MTQAERFAALKLTRNQHLVLDDLLRQTTPITAYEILDHLREFGFRAPLQVYRALDKLADMGVIHRLESLNAFVACNHDHKDAMETVAFCICDQCNTVSELADAEMTSRLSFLCSGSGFKASRTTLEIRGRCAHCASA